MIGFWPYFRHAHESEGGALAWSPLSRSRWMSLIGTDITRFLIAVRLCINRESYAKFKFFVILNSIFAWKHKLSFSMYIVDYRSLAVILRSLAMDELIFSSVAKWVLLNLLLFMLMSIDHGCFERWRVRNVISIGMYINMVLQIYNGRARKC